MYDGVILGVVGALSWRRVERKGLPCRGAHGSPKLLDWYSENRLPRVSSQVLCLCWAMAAIHGQPSNISFFVKKSELDDEWPESIFHHVGSQSVSYLLSVQCEVLSRVS